MILRNFLNVAMIIFMWLILANGIGLAIAMPSPHGMAGFVYAGFFVAIIGGIGHSFLYCVIAPRNLPKKTSSVGILIGLSSGIISFPIATLISEDALYFPHNSYQIYLFAYLCVLGALIGWLVTFIILRYLSTR